MDNKQLILQLVSAQGVLPLYFHKDVGVSVEVLKALYTAGIRAVEYTNRGEAALVNFRRMRQVCDAELPGMYLGIGTIKNADSATAFVDAGADYLVSPGLVEAVAMVADKNALLWVPGCMTPSEIIAAENLGATFIKLFPGNLLGPLFMSTIKELFPGLMFMPTGGVELEEKNLQGWFTAGVVAVGMGSKLITKKLMEEQHYSQLITDTIQALSMIRAIRNK